MSYVNSFLDLRGKHALLAPSRARSWATKDLAYEDLMQMIFSNYSQTVGTLLHEYAEDNIRYSIKMNKYDHKEVRKYLLKNRIPEQVAYEYVNRCFDNLMAYVNDAVNLRMDSEVVLVYSHVPLIEYKRLGINPPIFGTADALKFSNNLLRIHDLKTGTTVAHMEQLETYAALWCLMNGIEPKDIDIELRIYQSGEVFTEYPQVDVIVPIMDRIVENDKMLTRYLFGED